MSYFEMALARTKVRRHIKALDSDPTKWPVAAGVREYMQDCEFCGSRMPLSAMTFHIRRHMRQSNG